jgi:hypothetical protein
MLLVCHDSINICACNDSISSTNNQFIFTTLHLYQRRSYPLVLLAVAFLSWLPSQNLFTSFFPLACRAMAQGEINSAYYPERRRHVEHFTEEKKDVLAN